MKKKFLTFGILFLVLGTALAPSVVFGFGVTETILSGAGPLGMLLAGPPGQDSIWGQMAQGISNFLMMIGSLALLLCGAIFDWVIKFTIVDMSNNLGSGSATGAAITSAWATLRDIANMAFIFILLYAAFKAMFDTHFSQFGTTVKNIIIVALLINFSLFFTKVVIDASNIVSIGFYNSIVSSNPAEVMKNYAFGSTEGAGFVGGISAGYMRMLGMQTFYSADLLDSRAITDPGKILLYGFMAAVFMLITAVILLISGIMFATRFIILIFLAILSALAAIAYAIPGQQNMFKKWFDSLINQAIFAPVFFALTWVVFKVGSSLITVLNSPAYSAIQSKQLTSVVTSPASSIAIIINFVIIIGLAIAALVMSKQIAMKSPYFGATTAFLGGAVVGGVAVAGRNTLGRGANRVAESTAVRNWASKSVIGKKFQQSAQGVAKSSFDVRNSSTLKKVPGLDKNIDMLGKGGGKGGFAGRVEDKAKKEAEFAKKNLGLSSEEKGQIEEMKEKEKAGIKESRRINFSAASSVAQLADTERKNYMNNKIKDIKTDYEDIKREQKAKEKEVKAATDSVEKKRLTDELNALTNRVKDKRDQMDEMRKDIEENDDEYKKIKEKYNKAEEARKEAEKRFKKKEIDKEEYSAGLQTKQNLGDERQKKYANKIERRSPVSTTTGAVVGGAIGTLAGPLGTAAGAGIGAGVGSWIGSKMKKPVWAGNKAAARKIRADVSGPSKEKKLADAYKAIADSESEPSAPVTPPPPTGGGTTPTT